MDKLKTSITIGLIAILSGCSTLGNTRPTPKLKDGYEPKYNVNDCAKLDPNYAKSLGMTSYGTPVKVLFVDTKYEGYIVYMDHPRIKGPVVYGSSIKKFDKNWFKVDCE